MISCSEVKKEELRVPIRIKEAAFPCAFASGLEYSAPARGTWNIVHTGMLVPEAHEIFVCASSCLRGVVLTAAEMNALNRFSSIVICENNVLEGDMESLIIDGVTDILKKLPKKPPAVLLYTSCIHHFMGCDLSLVYRTLRKKFPDVAFTDCYMNPIMRKSGLTPDETMRRQLYGFLEKRPKNAASINIIGNNIATEESSELVRMVRENGYELKDIICCKTYKEYLDMSESMINISYNPAAKAAGDELEKRLGQKHLYLPLCYGYEEIAQQLYSLAGYLNIPKPDYTYAIEDAEQELKRAKAAIGNTPIAIDYTATMRPLGLARLLIEHGFEVDRVYVDAFNKEEKKDFDWLKKSSPNLKLYPTVQVKMRMLPRKTDKNMLAIGQKAAYFTGSNNFVNIVEGGGMYGFDGICNMAKLMIDAYIHTKDAQKLIQIKGLGCECLL